MLCQDDIHVSHGFVDLCDKLALFYNDVLDNETGLGEVTGIELFDRSRDLLNCFEICAGW